MTQFPQVKTRSARFTRTVRDYLIWLRRWFWIVPLTAISGYFLGQHVASETPSTYKSWALIEVKRNKKEAQGVDEEEIFRLGGLGEMLSLIEKLKTPNLLRAVAESSHIEELREKGIALLPEKRDLRPWGSSTKKTPAKVSPEALASSMRHWITITWRENTNLLDVYVVHTDPRVAQAAASGLLTEYERLKDESVNQHSKAALEYVLSQANEAKERAMAKENALQLYTRCLELKDAIREAEDEVVVLEKRYLPKWPPLIEATEMLHILQSRFLSELQMLQKLAEGPEREYWEEQATRLADLEEAERTDQLIRLVETRASILGRETETEKAQFTSLMTKWKEETLDEGFATTEFTVEQAPTLPISADGPVRGAITKDFAIKGVLFGIGIILLLGFLDQTVRSVEDVERLTGLEVLGAIPLIKSQPQEAEKKCPYPQIPDGNPLAEEAVRTLRAGLSFLGDKTERQTFLITSAVPSEGKSWVSSNLATAFALQGDKTLLVDFDLRKPTQHSIFDLDPKHPGITDYLSQGAHLEDVVQTPEALSEADLWIVGAGTRAPNPAELLTSHNVEAFMQDAMQYFDRIIVDTPPVLSVRDSLVLAKRVQSLVLVFRSGSTHARAINRTLHILETNRTLPVGIVINGLKGGGSTTYDHYYSYGNKSYEKYYATNE